MSLTIKQILREFLDYLETASCTGVRDRSSRFELPVTAKTLAQLEVALRLAKASDEQAALLSNGTPAKALIAGYVFQETGLSIQSVVADLGDEAVDALVICFSRLKESRLLLLEGSSIRFPKSGVQYAMLCEPVEIAGGSSSESKSLH